MKRNVLFSLLGLTFCFVSCATDNLYSCDPEIEQWTKSNLKEIQQMSKSSFNQLTPVKQLSVYRAFNAEKRIELWQSKIEEVLQMNLSDKEKNHIKALENVLFQKGYWFGNYTDKSQKQQINNEIDIFAYRWIEYAKGELKWDDVFIYKVVGNPNPVSAVDDLIALNSGNEVATRAEDNICRCRTGWSSCTIDCIKGNCDDDGLKGCGLLWLQDCDGKCGVSK